MSWAERAADRQIEEQEENVENRRLVSWYEEFISKIAIKAGAGCCQRTAEGKHQFLRDISFLCEEAGFDVLGDCIPSGQRAEARAAKETK